MLYTIRRHHKVLMFVIAALTIFAFAWLYNPSKLTELDSNVAVRAYGKSYTPADVERIARTYNLALALGQTPLIMGLGESDASGDASLTAYVVNLIVLRTEAARLGIVASDEEVASRIKTAAPFQTEGQFDKSKYETFVATRLTPMGMAPGYIEATMRDAICYDRVKALVASAALPSASEKENMARYYETTDLKVLRFALEAQLAATKLDEAAIQAEFDKSKDNYKAPEALEVEIAKFSLPEDKKALEKKERVAALQEVAGKAAAFAEGATDENFATRAAEATAEIIKPESYTRQTVTDNKDVPEAILRGAFFLVESDRKIGDVTQVEDSFFVARIVKRTSERPLEFDEAKPEIEKILIHDAATKSLREQADKAAATVRTALTAGEPLDAALSKASVAAEEVAGVSFFTKRPEPKDQQALSTSMTLQPGTISNPYETAEGFELVALVKRTAQPAIGAEDSKENKAADPMRKFQEQQLADNNRDVFFMSWLGAARDTAELSFSRNRRR